MSFPYFSFASNNSKTKNTSNKSYANTINESITSTVLPVYYQKDSNSAKLPLVTNKQQQQQSKSLSSTTKSNSILPTISNNPTIDSRVGSALVTISTSDSKQQEYVNRHQIITMRSSSPYVNFYESHPEATSSTTNTPPNRLANMYKSNLTNNYNSNAPIYLNDVNNTNKKHVHFFDSPYKFPAPVPTPISNNNNNSNKQQISPVKGIKVRSDMIFATPPPTVTNGPNYQLNNDKDVAKTSIAMISQAPTKSTFKTDENEESENYYYTTVNSVFTVKSESGVGASSLTPDSFVRPRIDDSLFTNVTNADIKSEHFNSTKKSILIKKKHRNPIVASISSKSSSNNSHKKVTFAT
jgi:hypothetical protein